MIKLKEKICFRCGVKILLKDRYFAFSEFYNKKIIKIDYAHKLCWNLFMSKIGDTTEAMSIIRSLKGSLVKQGILEPDKVIIT